MTASEHDHVWCILRGNRYLDEIARENAGLYDPDPEETIEPKAGPPMGDRRAPSTGGSHGVP